MSVNFPLPKILLSDEDPFNGLRRSESSNSVIKQDSRFLTVRKLRKKSLQKADKMVCEKSRAKETTLKVFCDDLDAESTEAELSQLYLEIITLAKAQKIYREFRHECREIRSTIDFAQDMATRIQTFKRQVCLGPEGLKEVLEENEENRAATASIATTEKVAHLLQEYRANFFAHTVSELFEITHLIKDQFKYFRKFCTDNPELEKKVSCLENLSSLSHLKDAKFLKSRLSDIHYCKLITICDLLEGAHHLLKEFKGLATEHLIHVVEKVNQINQNQLNHLGYKIIKTGEKHFKLIKRKVKISIV